MIEIQIAPFENIAAILAGVLVALEHIVPGKLHFLLRQPIEQQQHDHARDADLERNGRHHLGLRRLRGEIAPAIEIVGQEIVFALAGNDLGVSGVNQRKRAPGRTDVNRLPETV